MKSHFHNYLAHILSCLLLIVICKGLNHPNQSSNKHSKEVNHQFYALEDTSIVSKSKSIEGMNQCKQICLTMSQNFPFRFKYHRYIRRQATGLSKYFEGTCHFALNSNAQKWYPWSKMKIFIIDTQLFPNRKELKIWENYDRKCEDSKLKLDQSTVEALGYKIVHSNFEYYDDGTFKNLEPFTDLNQMLRNLGKGLLG